MASFGSNQKLYINQQVIVYSVFKVKSFSRLNRKIQESCQNEKQGKEFFLTPIQGVKTFPKNSQIFSETQCTGTFYYMNEMKKTQFFKKKLKIFLKNSMHRNLGVHTSSKAK